MTKKGDWLLWLNAAGYIQVQCSECRYRITSSEHIPRACPKCGSINYDENREARKAFLERW